MQEVLHVRERKPVLRQGGRLGADGLCREKDRPPKVVKKIQDQPRVLVTVPVDLVEKLLHVRQIVQQVGKDHVIKFFVTGKVRGLRDLKLQARMALTRRLDHRRAEIDADAPRRLGGGQEVAQSAAQFEDAQAGRNQKGIILFE